MTRKDYELLAQAIRTTSDEHFCNAAGRSAARAVTNKVADALAQDNPRFDRHRFMAACGFDIV